MPSIKERPVEQEDLTSFKKRITLEENKGEKRAGIVRERRQPDSDTRTGSSFE